MKILVTGATGLLGRHLTKRLCQEGHDVIAMGRNIKIGNEICALGANFINCDLTNKTRLMPSFIGISHVVHCAALSSPWGAYQDFYKANVVGTNNVVQCAIEQQVKRLIHISSPSVYFEFKNEFDIKENKVLPLQGANHYAQTKRLAERVIERAEHNGVKCIVLRPRAIFGEHDTTIFPRIIKAIRNNQFPLIGGGRALIDITYVENVVQAITLSLSANDNAFSKHYNITNGEPMLLKEVLDLLFPALNMEPKYQNIPMPIAMTAAHLMQFMGRLTGNEPRLTPYSAAVLGYSQTLNIESAKTLLGYQPKVSIEEGISRFARWWNAR